ncbi:MAG: hypothetical protein EP329_18850, partial [Deltaproteobacteria bacterium]
TQSGIYTIDPDGTGPKGAVQVWCDMVSNGGGWTMYKAKVGSAYNATQAEAHCQSLGMHLFIPRTKQHLLSAWQVATSNAYGPDATANYLYIMGIYPNWGDGFNGGFDGAKCSSKAFHSNSPGCDWHARDNGAFWVSERTNITEPNGDNNTDSSMYYGFDASGNVSWYNDIPSPGYTSSRFMCDTGDRDFIGRSCVEWRDAGFTTSAAYKVDPDGLFGPLAPFDTYCDQTTSGGGWTRLVNWNRESGSDTTTTLGTKMDNLYNNMSTFANGTGNIYWSGGRNPASAALAYRTVVTIPNGGEVRANTRFLGNSMEQSAVWLFGVVGTAHKEIICGNKITNIGVYREQEKAFYPGFTCTNSAAPNTTFSWDTTVQKDLGTSVSELRWHSMHNDDGTHDRSYLYRLILWVR